MIQSKQVIHDMIQTFVQNEVVLHLDDTVIGDEVYIIKNVPFLANYICRNVIGIKINTTIENVLYAMCDNFDLTGSIREDSNYIADVITDTLYYENHETFQIKGEKGGDSVKIQAINKTQVLLEVTHCYVKVLDGVVPNEFLSLALTQILRSNDFDICKIIENSGWSATYIHKLIEQVHTTLTIQQPSTLT